MAMDGDGKAVGPRRVVAFAAGAAALIATGALLLSLAGRTSIPPRLVLLVAVGTSVIALMVGYGLGFYADRGRRPGEGR